MSTVIAEHSAVALGLLVAAVAVSAAYLRRYQVERPPVGVYTFGDIVVMSAAIVAVPVLYLHVPPAAVSTAFGLVTLIVVRVLLQPIVGGPRATLATLALLVGDASLSLLHGRAGGWLDAYVVLNDLVLVVAVCAIANLYAQAGMKAAHVAALAAMLGIYDYIATAVLPTTDDLVARLAGHPFSPQIVVGWGRWQAGVGLGDALLAVVWVLVVGKAYGRAMGGVGAFLTLGSLAGIMACFVTGTLSRPVPAMVLMSPLILAQWGFCRRRYGPERTTREWRMGLPAPTDRPPVADPELEAAVAALLAEFPPLVARQGGDQKPSLASTAST